MILFDKLAYHSLQISLMIFDNLGATVIQATEVPHLPRKFPYTPFYSPTPTFLFRQWLGDITLDELFSLNFLKTGEQNTELFMAVPIS